MSSACAGQADAAPEAVQSRINTLPVALISAGHFVHDVYTGFLPPLLPLFIQKLSLSLAQAGLLTTVMQIPSLFNPVIGALADRVGARWFVILAPTLTAVPMCLAGMAPTYAILLLLLLTTGISQSIFHVPAPVVVARLSGARKGRAMSMYMTGGELARALSPLVAVSAVALFGLEGFYPIVAVAAVASVCLYLALRRFRVSVPQDKRTKPSMAATWREMRGLLLPLSCILCARGAMHASLTTFLPTFMQQQGGSLWLGGAALTVFEGVGVVGILAAGAVSDRFGRRRTLLLSLSGAPLALLLFTAADGWLRLPALVLTGFTLLSTTPVMLAMVQERATNSPAAANGFFMMISFLARSAIVVAVGWSGDLFGLHTTYYISACLGLLGIPFVLVLPATRKR